MVHDALLALWFLLPAALANTTPIIAHKIPLVNRWQAPIDGGRKFRGVELLGTHKTWRGLVCGMVVSTLVLGSQQWLASRFSWVDAITGNMNYAALPLLVLGPLFGLGALGGDAFESFFKRQRRIPSGHSWVPFDQIDYILGGILVSLPFVVLPWPTYVWMLVLYFGIHIGSTYIGYKLGLKERPI